MKKFMNQEDMKYENCMDVFYLIRELKQTTRKQIEAVTGLSWGAVSNITSRLLKHRFIVECRPEGGTGPGRTPSYLEVNPDCYCTIGLDVNLTGMKAELVNLKNQSLKTWSCESNYSSKESLLSSIKSIFEMVFNDEECKKYEIMGIGIAMQGIVDAQRGISVSLTQCKEWRDVPLASILEEKYKIPVWLEHDPNCILLAHGENSPVENAVLLRLDRAMGMSVMLENKIVGGRGMFEIGHTLVVPEGEPCSCGNKGCLEAYASVSAMEQRLERPFSQLLKDAAAQDVDAIACFEEMAFWLGISIYNIRKIFNVPDIILCGELTEGKEFFIKDLEKRNEGVRFTVIDANCASYGAAMIALDKSIKGVKI